MDETARRPGTKLLRGMSAMARDVWGLRACKFEQADS